MAGGRSARGASFTAEQRAAWGRAQDLARGAHSAGINALPRVPFIGPPRPLMISVPLDTKGPLLKANTAAANAAPKDATLEADVDSTCFSSLTWEGTATKKGKSTTRGTVTAVFAKNNEEYDAPCSRKLFLEWISSGSLGDYYWDELGGSEEGFFG